MYLSWASLWFDSAALGVEASQVISLRLAKMAVGDRAALLEAERMVAEKVDAAIEIQALAMTGALGFTPQSQTVRAIRKLRRKVESNRRRLSSGG